MTAKDTKNEVDYGRGMLRSHCGPTFKDDKFYCKHFIPGARYIGKCEKVEGDIEPIMWCELYHRATR